MTNGSTILVTGGAGFIGSHTCVELLEHGYEVVVRRRPLQQLAPSAGPRRRSSPAARCAPTRSTCATGDALGAVFASHPIDAVDPLRREEGRRRVDADPARRTTTSTSAAPRRCCAPCTAHGVHRLVFSSSCSIYGDARALPLDRGRPGRADQPVRAVQVDLRADARRRLCPLPGAARDRAAVLQPGRRAPQRRARRGPAAASRTTSCPTWRRSRSAGCDELAVFGGDYPTAGRHRRPRLHPRRRRRRRPPPRPGPPRRRPGHAGVQPRHRRGVSVLELVARVRVRRAAADRRTSVTDRRPGDVARLVADASRVDRELGLAHDPRPRRHVRATPGASSSSTRHGYGR